MSVFRKYSKLAILHQKNIFWEIGQNIFNTHLFFLVPFQPPTNQVEVTSTEIETSDELTFPCHIPLPKVPFNNKKNNKNLISLTGVLVLFGIISAAIIPTIVSAQYGLISAEFIVMYLYILSCCLPVGLPTMYFMFEPKHFISVLKHF